MCGIAGFFGPDSIPEERLRRCLDLMGRRGPDARGAYAHRGPGGLNVNLLHSRLSIIDLDPRSSQPFRDGADALVFNGEIYDYLEARKPLERAGRAFRTGSDTEVLLASLQARGTASLDSLDGMWAFAWYSERDGVLRLSRDRFGEKPLYLHRTGGGLYFGSEPKFIHALLGRRLAVDREHLNRYMVNGYRALHKGRSTFWSGLEEMAAGTVLTVGPDGRESSARYWEFRPRQEADMAYGEAVDGTRRALIDSMRLRLRSDVPIAFCMSGGVDSNSLISIAKREFGYDVHGFTISNRDPRYDEDDLVAESVKSLGIRHTRVPLATDGFLPKLRGLVEAHDGPVSTISYYVHWLLMESVAAHGYKICLSGTAADELFTGYFDHHLAYLKETEGIPDAYGPYLAAWREHILPGIQNPLFRNPRLFADDPGFHDHVFQDWELFSSRLVRPWSEPFREERFTDDVLRNRMLNELFHEVVPPILKEDDLNAMYFSIENRSPFLARGIFDFCQRIPTRHLMRDGFTKSVLRDAMAGIAPEAVLRSRRKVGFNAPVFSLLDRKDPAVRAALLEDSPVFDLVRKDSVEALLALDHLPNSESKFLFNFLNAKMFLEWASA